MAGMAASVPDIFDMEKQATEQMPCQTKLQSSHDNIQAADNEEECPLDCCLDDTCTDLSCHCCLYLHFNSVMLLGSLEFYFPGMAQVHSGALTVQPPNRSILPEIHPPALLLIS